MKVNKLRCEEEDADITEENKTVAFAHQVLAGAAEEERQGRVQPDRLTDEERETIVRHRIYEYRKKNIFAFPKSC
jgi:hypothetical protein